MAEIKNIKLNGTKLPLGGSGGGGGKVFENVTEIPSNPDSNVIYRVGSASGIVVPNTGLVDKVYFNTSLSIEEVIELVKNSGITFFDIVNQVPSTEQGIYVLYAAVDSKGTMGNTVQILYGEDFTEAAFDITARLVIVASVHPKDENGDYTNEETLVPIFVSDDIPSMGVSAGWQGIDSIEIGNTLINDMNGMSVGLENDKLTRLFSSTSDFSANFSASRYVNVINDKEFELANNKEEYVIEFEYDQNKYSSGSEFYDQVIKNYKLPDDLLSKFPDNINVRARITYTNGGMDIDQARVEEYELQDYLLFSKFGNGLRGVQFNLRYVNAANKTSNTIRLARFAADGEEVISNYFHYNYSLGSSSGSSVTVDTAMSDSSTNPVQNKIIKEYVDGKANELNNTKVGRSEIQNLATKDEVNQAITALVGSAPETLDTLKELADAVTNNKDILDTLNFPEIYLYNEPFPEANANVLQGIKLNNVPWNVPIGTPIKYIEFVKESTETFEQFVNRAIKTYEIPYQLAKAAKNKEISLVVRITMPNNLFTVHYDYILNECVYEETYLTWSNYSMLTFYNIRLTEDKSGNSVPTKHTVSLWTYYSSGTPTIMNSYTTTPLISTGGSGGSVDLSNYFTKTETEQAIQTAINNITKAEDGKY
jgi:hypothetical protein